MTNNSMASTWYHHTSSSSQHLFNPPPHAATNQPQENLLVATPPAKRPHGRPVGSNNKPKNTSLLISQPFEPSVKVIDINVDSGRDVMESIVNVARQSHVSLIVLSASGIINRVTFCNSPNNTTTLTLNGPFTLISLYGSYLYNDHYTIHTGATHLPPLSFGIHFSSYKGKVFSGVIGGRVIAGDNFSLTLSTFKNPMIYKYVPQSEEGNTKNNNNHYNNNPSDFNGRSDLLGFNIVN